LHYPGRAKTFYFTIASRRRKSSRLEGLSMYMRSGCKRGVCRVVVNLLVF